PSKVAAKPALIVAIDYCTGSAQAYLGGTQYDALAELTAIRIRLEAANASRLIRKYWVEVSTKKGVTMFHKVQDPRFKDRRSPSQYGSLYLSTCSIPYNGFGPPHILPPGGVNDYHDDILSAAVRSIDLFRRVPYRQAPLPRSFLRVIVAAVLGPNDGMEELLPCPVDYTAAMQAVLDANLTERRGERPPPRELTFVRPVPRATPVQIPPEDFS
ncbi:hypothetical protein FRC04_003288, partial [Tulasnella sp. 424]